MQSTQPRQIIAIGGGGFSMEIDNPLLDHYVLQAAHKTKPKICFIGTASGDAQAYLDKFYSAFHRYECEPTHLSLFKGNYKNLREFVLSQDIIYVGGGNTRNLLTLWRDWDLDRILYEAYLKGIVLAGISAGAICWFEQMLTDSVPGKLTTLNGLGWLKGFCIPHFDGEADRKPSTMKAIEAQELSFNGLGIDDGAAVHYIDEKCNQVVCSHPEKTAYLFGPDSGKPQILQNTYLGGQTMLVRRASLTDAEGIHQAHMRSIKEVCSKDYSQSEIEAWSGRDFNRKRQEDSIQNDFLWVVENLGEIAGYGHLRLFEKEDLKQGHILGLYLTPEVIGKQIGYRILELMKENAKDYGAKKIDLKSTLSAHEFYKRNGFYENGPLSTIQIDGHSIRCYPMTNSMDK